jgi:AAA domain
MDSAYERVIQALTAWGSSKRGTNWNCPGPMHINGDRKPSLTVTSNGTGVGLHCFTGCSATDITSALGLGMRDLFDEKDQRERRLIARYLYHDEHGNLQFSKTRYEPKDFLIWHPVNGGMDWAPKIGDAKPVLYKLRELNEAIARGETVYIVEGEKDVDMMARRGYAATCNYEGAGKWREGYAQYFEDAKVVIVADRDEAGYKHAKDVRETLLGKATSVGIYQSAVQNPKADISDHFDAGYSIEHLVPLGGAGFRAVPLVGLVAQGVKPPDRIADDMLYVGGLHSIAGPPDSGKTTIALWWALQLLQRGYPVAFLDEEGGEEIVAERLISLGAKSSDMNLLTYVPFPGKMWDDGDIAGLMEFLDSVRPAMVLWDSSAAFLARAGLDENSAPAVTTWWAKVLTPLARELRAAVVVIDHDTKASEMSRYARGSGAKLAASDVQYKVEMKSPFNRNESGVLRLTVTKDRRGYLHRTWLVNMESNSGSLHPQFVNESEKAKTDLWSDDKRKIYGALNDDEQTVDEIAELYAKLFAPTMVPHRDTIVRLLNELNRDGYATKILPDRHPNQRWTKGGKKLQ